MIPRVGQTGPGSSRIRGLALAVAVAFNAWAGSPAQALNVGHARMTSAAGQPLRLLVPLVDVSPDEAATLAVRLANAGAWQQSGLTPPMPLAELAVMVQPGIHASKRDLIITATSAPQGDVVDVLLEVETSAGQRRIQVSFVVPTQAAPGTADIQAPRVGMAQTRAHADRVVAVRRGNTLSGIAQRHRYADVNLYQMLAALYQANPHAFIQRNMNLVKAGATLAIPDAQTVRAIDPAEARRLFLAHDAAFARYRAGMAESANVVVGGSPESGRLDASPTRRSEEPAVRGDRLRLSQDVPSAEADQAADEEVAHARAEQDSAARVAQLERNIDDLNRVLAASARGQDSVADSRTGDAVQHGDEAASFVVAAPRPVASATSATEVGAAEHAPTASVATDTDAASIPPNGGGEASPKRAGLFSFPNVGSTQSSGATEPDSLLVWITGLLAVLALIIAWVMRRAGGRDLEPRADDDEQIATESDDGAENAVPDEGINAAKAVADSSASLNAQLARRLESIDLELTSPPDDGGHLPRR